MNKALVIIDVQPEFETSFDENIIKSIKKEIRKAKQHNYPAINVEYINGGDPFIKTEHVITKTKDDGSHELSEFLKQLNPQPTELIITGVNIAYCVHETAIGLKRKLPQIKLTAAYKGLGCRDLFYHTEKIDNILIWADHINFN